MHHLTHLLLIFLKKLRLIIICGCTGTPPILASPILNGQVQLLVIMLRKLFYKVNGVDIAGNYGDVLVAVVALG